MTISNNAFLVSIVGCFIDIISSFFKVIARLFGYPGSSGLPILLPTLPSELPMHTGSASQVIPIHNYFEIVVGALPKPNPILRYSYASSDEGFYNFYIQNYQNLFFLPDWLSEFIQIKLNICLDLTNLDIVRETLFASILLFAKLISLRLWLTWLISINPYIFPWCYLTAMVDWTEDLLVGLLPTILGVNITGTSFVSFLGVIADSLNHLVFTMPFLPSEGEVRRLINDDDTDGAPIILFHYLPFLWSRYPIPNDIREFWYQERLDILLFLEKSYKGGGFRFLPDGITELPDEIIALLSEETESSGEETESSGEKTESSGEKTESSGEKTESSGEKTESSGEETKSSGQETKSSGEETKSSGQEIESSGQETKSSDIKLKLPDEKPIEIKIKSSGEEIKLSDVETDLPDVETDLPDVETGLPDVETGLPDVLTDLPDVLTDLVSNHDYFYLSGFIFLN